MNACTWASCQLCGRCTAGPGEPDHIETCAHPGHWRNAQGGCDLCHAQASTLARQQAQRQVPRVVRDPAERAYQRIRDKQPC